MHQKRTFSLWRLLAIVLGDCLYSLSVQLFIRPGNLLTGGTTGISLAVEKALGIPAPAFMLAFNSLLFLLGLILLGKDFALTTLLSTFVCPLSLALFERLLPGICLTANPMLCTVFGGLGIGAGLGIVIRNGASTGGMDIPPFLLQKYFRIPVSVSLYFFDICILLAQALFSDTERILYSILLVCTYTIVLNKVLVLGHNRTEVKIISSKAEQIRDAILYRLDRGVTLLHGTGGYSRAESPIVLTIISNRELTLVENLARELDPQCFLIVSRVSQVLGRGFSLEKQYGESHTPPSQQ